jgi:Ca-activated chloride channel family protein
MMQFATPHTPPAPQPEPSTGGRLVTTTGRALPLLGTVLAADAEGGLARVTLEQRFRNPYAEPLAVTYSLPLPADGAVSGFCFTIGERRVVGEIDAREAARERYEEALIEGRSAALLEQDRSSLFTQEIGNIPPGVEVVVEVSVDQRLRWLDEGAWEWRFPTVVAPRYLGEAGRVPDADRVTQDVADGPLPARFALGCTVRDRLADGRRPESPSHAVDTAPAEGGLLVQLRDRGGARLDRDVVVRWAVATPKVGVQLATCRPDRGKPAARSAYGLLTVVPPMAASTYRPVSRDLIVLVDTSGSMSGEPLAQAARVVSAIVETLRDEDTVELIEFGSAPRRWKAHPVSATAAARREAIKWLHALRASGATEMRTAIVEALSGVRHGAQRQVVLVTDGQIGFEAQVVQAILDRLPVSSRLHTVGVGSAVNRSLTGPAARAGHGVEVVIGLGEDPERAASRIVARTSAPILVDLAVTGSAVEEHAPARLPDLFAGAPALIGVALRPEGGQLVMRGRTPEGTWEQRVEVPPVVEGHGNAGIAALFGREKVEDLEMRLGAGAHARDIDASIERLGIDFQISTRLTSWIAVSEERTVSPGDPLRRERMPHELPFGMSAEGLGLRAPMGPVPRSAAPARMGIEVWNGRPGVPMAPGRAGGMPPRRPVIDSRQTPAGGGGGRPAEASRSMGGFRGGGMPPSSAAKPAPEKRRREIGASISEGLGKLKERIFGGGEKRDEEKKEAAPPAKKTKPASGPSILRGKVTLHRAGLLVIEIVVEGAPLDWQPGADIRVALAGNQAVAATLDEGRSTRAGTVAVGATARLAITLPADAPLAGVLNVTLELGGDIVLVEV